jgi:hypothetical protein
MNFGTPQEIIDEENSFNPKTENEKIGGCVATIFFCFNSFFNNLYVMVKDDFEYLGFYVYYLPHPALYGNWEIFKDDEFIARVCSKKEAKKICKEKT